MQVRISRGEHQFVAECLDLPVVTQASTLDELIMNIREAIVLHLDGEELAALGLTANSTILATMESKRWLDAEAAQSLWRGSPGDPSEFRFRAGNAEEKPRQGSTADRRVVPGIDSSESPGDRSGNIAGDHSPNIPVRPGERASRPVLLRIGINTQTSNS